MNKRAEIIRVAAAIHSASVEADLRAEVDRLNQTRPAQSKTLEQVQQQVNQQEEVNRRLFAKLFAKGAPGEHAARTRTYQEKLASLVPELDCYGRD